MKTDESKTNVSQASLQRRQRLIDAWGFYGALLILLLLSLYGCATPSVPLACNCPAVPPLPSVSTQTSPPDYSLRAAKIIQSWRETLMQSGQSDRL